MKKKQFQVVKFLISTNKKNRQVFNLFLQYTDQLKLNIRTYHYNYFRFPIRLPGTCHWLRATCGNCRPFFSLNIIKLSSNLVFFKYLPSFCLSTKSPLYFKYLKGTTSNLFIELLNKGYLVLVTSVFYLQSLCLLVHVQWEPLYPSL